ncbi:DUF6463 family protein [Marinomonas sp. PE14-40]|uniref:DUF6463 family protein n=1 Tax=Marinomonas sp. PE14-40 TaxID=3060621 RepID=UPI003F6648FF
MKYSGYYLIATGILHSVIGLILGWETLLAMHQDNWLASTMIGDQILFDREAISWFLLSGVFWILFGLMLQKALDEGFIPPVSLAWGFILIGIIVAIIMPVSGAYFFIIQGIVLLLGCKAKKRLRSLATNLS